MIGPVALGIAIAMIAAAVALGIRRRVIVYPWETVLLYRNGAFQRTLETGVHHYFDARARTKVVRLAAYAQRATFGALDVISADRFSFRLHVALAWSLADPRTAYEAQDVAEIGNYAATGLNERVAAAALAVVGAHSLDAAIGDPTAIAAAIRERLAASVTTLTVDEVNVTRFELPPETRRMLTDVERARREGQAALERARAEQASLRALANAARLVKDNPELAQLRLLKTIEDAKGPTTIVLGDPRMAAVL